MTDIEVSDCCGYHVTRNDKETLTCTLCGNPCNVIWEIIIWQEDTSDHPPSTHTPHTTTGQNTGTTPSPATNDHADERDALHDREH